MFQGFSLFIFWIDEQLVCLESLRHKTSCPKDTKKKKTRDERKVEGKIFTQRGSSQWVQSRLSREKQEGRTSWKKSTNDCLAKTWGKCTVGKQNLQSVRLSRHKVECGQERQFLGTCTLGKWQPVTEQPASGEEAQSKFAVILCSTKYTLPISPPIVEPAFSYSTSEPEAGT